MAIKYQPSTPEKVGDDADKKTASKPDLSKKKPKSESTDDLVK